MNSVNELGRVLEVLGKNVYFGLTEADIQRRLLRILPKQENQENQESSLTLKFGKYCGKDISEIPTHYLGWLLTCKTPYLNDKENQIVKNHLAERHNIKR